jgi:hypothetical protein
MDPAMMAMLMQMAGNAKQGAGQFLSGLTGHSGRPYDKFADAFKQNFGQAKEYQNPFYNAGKQGLNDYQDWTNTMKDPSGFVNSLMNNYQQSPYAKFQMQQGQNAANNAASASGLMGSTPYMQASQDYARDITSQDQNQWLQNVLGVNKQYGEGKGNLMTGGQNAANSLSALQQMLAQNMGEAAYGKAAGENQDRGNMWSGALKFLFG